MGPDDMPGAEGDMGVEEAPHISEGFVDHDAGVAGEGGEGFHEGDMGDDGGDGADGGHRRASAAAGGSAA
jgi:hypothetical protein